jgi:sodium/proline symporter
LDVSTTILITLVAYKVLLIGIGFWASHLNKDGADFYLGGRQLGPWVAALSSSASSSSAWTMLGLSGVAFKFGLSFVWLVPACISGFIMNWLLVARRMRRVSAEQGSLTLTEFVAGDSEGGLRRAIVISASLVTLVSLGIYVASQFQGAGKTFEDALGLEPTVAILVGAAVVFIYTVTGGFWAVSVSDLIQGLMMAVAAIVVPVVGLLAVQSGSEGLLEGLSRQGPNYLSLTGGRTGGAAVLYVMGLCSIGLAATGQPHVVNRFMALRSEDDVKLGAVISISWSIIVFCGMFLSGLCGRVLYDELAGNEKVLIHMITDPNLFPPVLGGLFVAAILSAIMSTADSQLLVCGSTVAHDLPTRRRTRIAMDRVAVLAVTVLAVMAALTVAKSIFDSALFAWSALGAAFGPIVLVRTIRGPIRPRYTLAAIWLGFGTTLAWFFTPALKSICAELLPGFLVALAITLLGSRRRSKLPNHPEPHRHC